MVNILIARPRPEPVATRSPSVSVVVPARNEAGNIARVLERTPEMGRAPRSCSSRGTRRTTRSPPSSARSRPIRTGAASSSARPAGEGRCGPPGLQRGQRRGAHDPRRRPHGRPRGPAPIPRALLSGRGEFINGVRLVYPMADKAMRFLNLVGNKFFSLAFTWLLGQPYQGHALRDQGAVAGGLPANRGEPLLLRGLRPVRRLRFHLRRLEARPRDRRGSDPIP